MLIVREQRLSEERRCFVEYVFRVAVYVKFCVYGFNVFEELDIKTIFKDGLIDKYQGVFAYRTHVRVRQLSSSESFEEEVKENTTHNAGSW
jgi:hypothetical protein